MDGNFNLENWLKTSIDSVKKNGITCDIHLDEFDFFQNENGHRNVDFSINMFKNAIQLIDYECANGIGIYLSIDLCSHPKLGNSPKNLNNIYEQYDTNKIPEIIIYKPYKPEIPPQLQFYRVPLSFIELECDLVAFYKEFRTLDEMNEDDDFSREINIVYTPR
jgi:hypothetical protein